jgi:hypothetical protein
VYTTGRKLDRFSFAEWPQFAKRLSDLEVDRSLFPPIALDLVLDGWRMVWGLFQWTDCESFFDGPFNMPRGHRRFAVRLVLERDERLAPLVGDVEASTLCHAS